MAASYATSTMGELALMEPDEYKDEFKQIVNAIVAHYPTDWESWGVINYSFEELFGKELNPAYECKMRFGLPTIDLVKAFTPDANDLSERTYRFIRKILLDWPIGRALLYSPQAIMDKIHAPSLKNFMNTIKTLKPLLTNREATANLLRSKSGVERTTHSKEGTPISSHGTRRSSSSLKRSRLQSNRELEYSSLYAEPPEKRPAIRQGSSDHLLAAVLQQQTEMFNRLLDMTAEQNKKLELLGKSNEPNPVDLDASYESIPHSTQYEDRNRFRIIKSPTPPQHYGPPRSPSPVYSEEEEAIKKEIEEAQRRLTAHRAAKCAEPSSPSVNSYFAYDFHPSTVVSETKFSKSDPILAQQGVTCQRFGNEDWKNVKYSDVQKQFQSSPVFCSLKVNSHLASVTPSWTSTALLEKIDLTLGAITNGLLQQRRIFLSLCDSLPQEVKHKVGEEFLTKNSDFRKNSEALLQYVCGRRAEAIQLRRDTNKIKNKALHEVIHSIPPSETHLFKEPELSQAVKDHGGVHKFFPFKKHGARTDYKRDKKITYKREPTRNFKPYKTNYKQHENKRTLSGKHERQASSRDPRGQKWKGNKKA